MGVERGIRADAKNHNWIILEEYLALPFSYMSFVIKDFIETTQEEDRETYIFDPEPYNYLLNKSTSFLDGNFVRSNPAELQYVLENLYHLDKGLIELLHYTQTISINKDKDIQEKKEAVGYVIDRRLTIS